jgi:hypothetical protein
MKRSNYAVLVGNIGTAHTGNNRAQAIKEYREWKAISESNRGRAAGESVTLYCDGEPILEHLGTMEVEQ